MARSGLSSLLTILPLAVLLSGAGYAQEPGAPGIFGTDDRHVVDSVKPPWSALGQVNRAGYRDRRLCSGTLIAPDRVVTAAHCVFDRLSRAPYPSDSIHFVAGVRRDKHLGHSTAACVRHYRPPAGKPRGRWHRYVSDIAVMVLNQPLDPPPVPLADTSGVKDGGIPLVHAGYPSERRFLPSVDDGCHLTRAEEEIWFSDCDTNLGNSGGPVFVYADGQMRLAAVSVAIVPYQANIAVPASVWADFALNATCE